MMVDSDVPAQSSAARGGRSDPERAMRFECEAHPLLDALYRGALALTGDRLEAADLLDETMMNARRRLGLFRESRASTRLRSAELEALEALPAAVITKALQVLRLDARMVVYYADVEGFSHAEIAHITNCSVNGVISLLRHGRHQLRDALLAACREQAASEFPDEASNNTAQPRHLKPKCAKPKYTPLQRLSEGDTCASQLDWFDREVVRYVVLWAPHGEGRDEDVYPMFGMTVEQLVNRFNRIIDISVPRLGRLAKSDRELVDKARQLPTIFGKVR